MLVGGLLAVISLAGCSAGHQTAGRWHSPVTNGEGGPEPSGSPVPPPAGGLPTFPPPPQAVPVPLPSGPRAAWLSRIRTDQKVAFLTIDDGWIRTPEAL